MDTFTSSCPTCEQPFEALASSVGRVHACEYCGQECIVPSNRIAPGTQFGEYIIQYPLGLGASGEVHLALDPEGCEVALKVLFLEGEEEEVDLRRFLRESDFISDLHHEGIIQIYGSGQEHGHYYIAMEYVVGETLDHHLEKFGELALADAIKICRDVASVMAYAWNSNRIVHRDIKPANLMVSYEGVTKVMDLGIAKSFMYDFTQLTDPETIIGSPPYMSPEQCNPGKPIDFRADIYSLGCTLYQLVTGEFAFYGETPMATVRMQIFEHHTDPRQWIPGLPQSFSNLIDSMLAKSISNRPPSWEHLIQQLDIVAAEI
ncbi:MAG: serine/threonine protein kinase [Lentisphaeria bacterium]|nr:serine/threonine protein kinase [Lentisphaeria bacterium]